MANFGKKMQTDNEHLANSTSARFVHVTAGSGTALNRAGRLLRVVLNTNGATVTLKNGASEVIGVIATDAPEGTFDFGVYCNDSIRYECSGAVDATIIFDT